MNFDYDFNSSASTTLMDVRMMPHHHHHHNHHHAHQTFNPNLMHTRNTNSSSHGDDLNGSSHTFDCLINEVDTVQVDCIQNESKSDEETDRFDLINQANPNQLMQHQNQQQQQKDLNNIQQLQAQHNHLNLNDSISLKNKQVNRTSSNANLCSNIEKNLRFETTSSNKFHYVLMAPTSPAVKANEDTLTYLNQGQNYELRINRVANMFNSSSTATSSSSFMNESRQLEDIKPLIVDSKLTKNANDDNQTMNRIVCGASDSESTDKLAYHNLNDPSSNCTLFLSIVRVCFWDRKLQEIEHEEIKEWKKEYSNMRMLEIDNTSSFGTVDIRLSDMFTNAAEVVWNGKTGASIFFRCNCTSTAFAPNKHGGEKGIHMRFQVDTYELLSSSTKYHSNLALSNYYQASNLSPSNSSSISSSSSLSSSTSSFLSQDLKLAKDDFDCMSASDFKNLKDKEQENFRSPSPIIDYSTGNYWKHICSSFCRIQLFRLKGAQRKLKTDKSKVERLNPPDLRKRYQPSNKVTVLSNNQFDSLYSLLPFSRYANSNNPNNISHSTVTPDGSIDNCLNMMDNRSLSIDYSGINTTNTPYYMNNTLSGSSHSMLTLYNGDATSSGLSAVNNYAIQPILVVQQQQQQQQQTNLQLNKPKQNDLTGMQTNELSKVCQLLPSSSSISSSSASSTSSQDDTNYFLESNSYYDANSTKTLQSDMSTSQQHISLVNSANEENSANYTDELVYTRLKRASSISSINSNASYGSNGNYNYKNAKFQKTSSMSSVPTQNKYINLSPNFNPIPLQYQQTNQQPQNILISTTNNSQQIYTQQSMSPSSKQTFVQDTSKMNQFNIASPVGQLETTNTNLYKSKILPNDCNFKYVQEWLITNRFGHLLHLFANYTSNDLLRLSKEDMISLCGAPDGIRCFNMAHNIQIKPKLTIFVTFQNQTYFSAVFLADWKNKFLIQKLLSLYTSFVTSITENRKASDDSDDSDESNPENKNEPNETMTSSASATAENESHSPLNNSEMNSDKTEIIMEHQQMHEKMCNSKLDYELFLKIKDILVQTTDEVLNNLSDQSRFLVKFETPTNVSSSSSPLPSSPTTPNMSSPPPQPLNDQSKFALNKSIKILMIPLD